MPNKILAIILASDPKKGGGFQYSRTLLHALASAAPAGYRLAAVCLNSRWADVARPLCHEVYLVRPFSLGWQKLRGLLRRLPGGEIVWKLLRPVGSPLWRQLRSLDPALVFSPCEPHLMLDSPAPAVVPIHDLMYIYEKRFPEVGMPAIYRARLLADRMVCRDARGILVDSKLGARHVQESFGVEASRLHVLPYVAQRFIGNCEEPIDEKWCRQMPERFLVYPAQFWLHKNHIGLLRALKLLNDSGLQVNFVFCGSEKNANTFIAQSVQDLQVATQVKCVGFVTERQLQWLYQNAVAMVMPSFFGPTNIPALEAMHLGCPVAVARVYAMEEQLGNAALYFDPNNPEEIAGVVRQLWTQPSIRTELIENGSQRIRSWSFDDFAVQLKGITSICLKV